MTLKQPEALPELRWVERQVRHNLDPDGHVWEVEVFPVLQQRWRVPQDPTPESLSATALEWRDVPVVEEERGV